MPTATIPRPVFRCLLLLGVLCALPAAAQEEAPAPPAGPGAGVVLGRVLDRATGLPIEGAWVRLHGQPRLAHTDDNGVFRIDGAGLGDHPVTVGQVGYDALKGTWRIGEAGLELEVRLAPQPVVLEAVRVVSDRFASRARSSSQSVRAFGPDVLERTTARDGEDFLRTRAGLQVTFCRGEMGGDFCVWRRGSVVQPCIIIDERPAMGGAAELRSYPASALYRVDVIGGHVIQAYTRFFVARMEAQGWRPTPADALTQIACMG